MPPRRSNRKSTVSVVNDVAPAPSPSRAATLVDSTTTDSRHRQQRTRSTRSFVPNSSDQEEESHDIEEPEEQTHVRRVLKEVSIPVMKSKKAPQAGGRLARLNAQQAEQESSTDSPSLENSDAETPGTSIATTPAASVSRGKRSTRKGKKAPTPSQSTSSGLKRSRNAVPDSESEDIALDMDAEIALQMQLEDEMDVVSHKRRKIKDEEDIDMLSEDEPLIKSTRKRVPSYTGKGKGKAKAEDLHGEADSLLDELSSPPPYKGKGKGKAEEVSSKRRRSVRSSAKKVGKFTEDDMLDDDESDGGEFHLESDDESVNDVDSAPPTDCEDSDLPLAMSSRLKKLVAENPTKVARKKKLTAKDKTEANRRRARFAHIADKWERKRAMNRERAEQQHPKLITMWDDLQKIPVLEVQKAEQPKSINRRLKPFQLEGLSWMIRQEQTHYKGGLLGDEMGMGKTIQAVSLIMSDYPAKQPTLVCVPPVALMQWSNEIREYTDNKLKVLVYHGTNAKCKKMTVKELKSYDVIMVSYNSLESLHRKETKGWSRGEDIIKEASPLHAIHYHRLILDEAHSIKSRNTGVAKACFALTSNYKWCLSGTPVQNRIGEFFSLLRFLEVRPFADYFCRSCDCEKLHWATDDDHMCVACNHGASEHISVFNQELLNPITGDDVQLREEALTKLHLITARIMLRRMKRDHTSSMELPMKDIIIHNEFFSEVERDFSTSIMSNSARKFDTYVAQGVMLNNYANIFGLIMQMRQVANHPDLLLKKNAVEGAGNVYVCNICDEPAEDAVRSHCRHEFCRACIKDLMDTCEASGTEADCPRCHIALSIDFEQPELEQDEDSVKKTSIINRIKMENWTSSTKIEMLVYDLYKLRSKKQTLKSIVFSQFTSMLQLIEWRLRRAGFNTVMLDGSMTPAQRQKSIDHFMTNPDVEVFLVSLKAGGVALNLTEASRVFIVDPWWNPAAEWQSADRCHRIGQRRPCVITRLCVEDSVESRMVALQEKKAAMIAGTINNDKVAMDRLSPEDLQFLFRGT
ncbi:HepA Superfamily II DNA RNA helicase SNF2 family [Pyrenophora tritici-repentis]|uniref:Helicase SWR1 n=2 Tax=Pyrenophora tritici-repentis TaxID=45151 RepID=A0A2W1EUG0_9PLEO|nr:helicase SWR1 [Pyrenophora tritici-repentis Pt-1C-BFP]KAA8625891.1 Helicase SWR1 [Pyrenophora tritici-repentis]EDU40690.1 helicase SWR1 [Pyrenophora tritici-repentis Pt-1C-BFP]KAF7454306.1 Helicase SWR1 [Pyrenophora tritici-repentis]KAF7577410.1 HepA, Superfamily II DNA-RNA helicase, SNF2 family [Pyrenophora tritici-repentis]KAG9388053.1 Helicase SWR1 [Pyrenophora tritici-repentis]